MKKWAVGVACLVAGAALAHEGVKNPAVMARMDGMSTIGAETKILGQMAKGEKPFEADVARAAAAKIATEAARIEPLFKAPEKDPMSESLPAVWTDFPDFVAKAKSLEDAALRVAEVTTKEELQTHLREIGATCSACHKVYRKP